MIKYYISVIALGIFVLVLIVTGVVIAGSPISQKDVQLDNIRIQVFNDIKYQTENYYKANRKLPSSLIEIKSLNIKDPETKNDYEYKTQPPYGYQLCTTFSTDNSEIIDRSGYANYDSDSASYKKHKKGYDCMTFKISDYVLNSIKIVVPTIYYYPTPGNVVPTTYNNSLSFLRVNSIPQGIQMTSTGANYAGTTPYVKSSNGQLSIRIDAPLNASMDGENYEFSAWSGCNNDTTADQFCTVLINESTVSITATYNKSSQELPQN